MTLRSPLALGAVLREAREQAGLTQAALAREIGTSRHSVLRLEQGHPGVELGTVLKALDRLGLELTVGPRRPVAPSLDRLLATLRKPS